MCKHAELGDDIGANARSAISALWPQSAEWLEGGVSYFWNADRWSRGSYAYFAPGQMVKLRQLFRQPVGRIHFAGEHTANWQGYMHGAIESGYRAAKEIDQMISCVPCHSDR
jgi:monoamine oxidase